MKKLMSKPGVLAIRGDMCQFKMQIPQSKEGEYCQKATQFLMNSPQIAAELSKTCRGGHEHTRLEGGNRTKLAQIYPDALCDAICRGAAREREYREQGLYAIGAVDVQGDEPAARYEGEHEEDDEEVSHQEGLLWRSHVLQTVNLI